MALNLDKTHDPERLSWVETANVPGADFPLQNLPYGVFRRVPEEKPRIGAAIGDQIFDLHSAAELGLVPPELRPALREPTLNGLMAMAAPAWSRLRFQLSELLGATSCPGYIRSHVQDCLRPQKKAAMLLPAQIGDYTDFYASVFHATNVGAMFRPEQPLLPNYKWVPIGYHGRSSSIVVSGTPVPRPRGQAKLSDSPVPCFGPTRSLDYELELGVFVGPGNALGERIPVGEAGSRLFGVVLLNDWSARDLQSWEYQPLGPFLAKNFCTTISPWVVTIEALAPFRVPAFGRPAGDPAPLAYLADSFDQLHGGLDLTLEVHLCTRKMRAAGEAPHRLSSGNFSSMYWTLAQLLTHHASNGCPLRPGDLLGSGTVSGPTPESRGCLLERTGRGAEPLNLPNGEERRFLLEGDEIILRGFAQRAGYRRIGLGECRGIVAPVE
jgi:fumarylacetoacetase